jgi:hypothetical protein
LHAAGKSAVHDQPVEAIESLAGADGGWHPVQQARLICYSDNLLPGCLGAWVLGCLGAWVLLRNFAVDRHCSFRSVRGSSAGLNLLTADNVNIASMNGHRAIDINGIWMTAIRP